MQKILSTVRQAVEKYGMIADGDKIAVGVSGGKDSVLLLSALTRLKEFYPHKFDVMGITVDPCFDGVPGDYSEIAGYFSDIGAKYYVNNTDIAEIVFGEGGKDSPCSLCSRLRKGALYSEAIRLGCNKVALGHHADDAAATFYMSLLYNGTLQCFSPVTELPEKGLRVIRPLIFTRERDIVHEVKEQNIPTVKSSCPANGNTSRSDTELLIKELDKKYGHITDKVLGALQRSHLCGW